MNSTTIVAHLVKKFDTAIEYDDLDNGVNGMCTCDGHIIINTAIKNNNVDMINSTIIHEFGHLYARQILKDYYRLSTANREVIADIFSMWFYRMYKIAIPFNRSFHLQMNAMSADTKSCTNVVYDMLSRLGYTDQQIRRGFNS